MSNGVAATLFLKADVEALARVVHGDLEAHLTKRKVEREERSQKLQATKAKKLEKAHQRALQIIEASHATGGLVFVPPEVARAKTPEGFMRFDDRRGQTYYLDEEEYLEWPSLCE